SRSRPPGGPPSASRQTCTSCAWLARRSAVDPVLAGLAGDQPRPAHGPALVRAHLSPQVDDQIEPPWPRDRVEDPAEVLGQRRRDARRYRVDAVGGGQREYLFGLV